MLFWNSVTKQSFTVKTDNNGFRAKFSKKHFKNDRKIKGLYMKILPDTESLGLYYLSIVNFMSDKVGKRKVLGSLHTNTTLNSPLTKFSQFA